MKNQVIEKLNGPSAKYARMRRKLWELRDSHLEYEKQLTAELNTHPIVSRILANRNYDTLETAKDFLDCSLAKLQNPFMLKDMEKAVKRIHEAIENNKQILIYGDYDTDGTTSTAILLRTFEFLNYPHIQYYIPHRLNEGYGLTIEAIDQLNGTPLDVIITVDNGISAVEAVEYANSKNIEVIITDHHQAPAILPEASAVVNPKQPDCNYPFKSLAGCGVTFKLVHALLKELGMEEANGKAFLASLLDLVAIGTVADIVPLLDENRSIVSHGMKRIQQSQKVGLQQLMYLSGCKDRPMRPGIISYFLTPRLNAAGRMDHAGIAVELLITNDPNEAERLAYQLEELNELRRKLELEILEEAMNACLQQCDVENDKVIVISGRDWHLGVVGIVASRILEHYHKPVIILSEQRGMAMGSARSLPSFDIHDAIGQCNDLLMSYGGHKMAAGLKMDEANVSAFRELINKNLTEANIIDDRVPTITIDAEVTPSELNLESVEAIRSMEPFGSNNPEPLLVLFGAELLARPQIVGNNHLKLFLGDKGNRLWCYWLFFWKFY